MVESIRKATYDDALRLIPNLVRAFDDDPATNWIVRQDKKRSNAFNIWFRLCLCKISLPHDEVYVTDDCIGGALWIPPEILDIGFIERIMLLPDIVRTMSIRGIRRSVAFITSLEEVHPKEKHFYLQFLGVDPDHQGKGVGSSLIKPILHICDRESCGAYLETSKEKNLGFYERHGFVVSNQIVTRSEAPPVWTMWRDPQLEKE